MSLHLKAAICPAIADQGGEDYEKFCLVKWLVGGGGPPAGDDRLRPGCRADSAHLPPTAGAMLAEPMNSAHAGGMRRCDLPATRATS
jgi:hypothetical protein